MRRFYFSAFSLFWLLHLTSFGQKLEKPQDDADKKEKKIEYLINRNEVTFRIAYNLVDWELRFPPRTNIVRDTLDSYFSNYKKDKIVMTLSEADIGYDDVLTQYLLHQKEFPDYGSKYDDTKTIEEMELDGYKRIDTLYSLIYKELYDFYRNANVENFIAEMDFYYSGAIQEIKTIASQYDVIQQMEDYCRMDNYKYIVSPEPLFLTGGSRGIGPSVTTESGKICYQFISPSENIDLSKINYSEPSPAYGYADKSYIRSILVHEFGHSFVDLDMGLEATSKFINTKNSLFTEDVKQTLENTGIGDFHTFMIEHIVRLLEIRIADIFISEVEANKLREINSHFIWLPQMEELTIKEYESRPEEFKNFSEFIPELLSVVN